MEEKFDNTIEVKNGWFDLNLKELVNYKYLIMLFIKRDFAANYKQTILGPIWFLVQPILTTVIFTIVFGNIAKLPTGGAAPYIFYFSGLTCWNYFAACLTKTSDTFIINASVFGKVYFPRLTVPISIVLTNIISFALQLALLIGLIISIGSNDSTITISYRIFFVPLMIIQMAMLGLGLGIIVSSLTTKYRDLAMLVGFGTQLWMYATPVAYSIDMFPVKWHSLLYLNPMTAIIENFRFLVLGIGSFNFDAQLISTSITVGILFIGIVIFSKVEKTFTDTI